MAPYTTHTSQSLSKSTSSTRALAMALALASSIVLSPLYNTHYEARFLSSSSAFLLPMVLAGLIIGIKITSSSSSSSSSSSGAVPSPDPSWVLRIGSSSWGLAAVLVMLVLVLSWQESAQEFFWR